jgi:hypothetical protein
LSKIRSVVGVAATGTEISFDRWRHNAHQSN